MADNNVNNDSLFDGWETGENAGDFFEEFTQVEKPPVSDLLDQKKEDKTSDELDEVAKNQAVDFGDFEDEKEEEEDDDFTDFTDKEEESLEDENTEFKTTLSYLTERGLIEVEEGNEEEDPKELITTGFEKAIDKQVDELLGGLSNEVKQLNKFVLNGGNFDDFVKEYAKAGVTSISKNLDLDNPSNQELVLKETLLAEGEDEETIDAQVEFYKENGKLESIAKNKFEKWKKKQTVLAESLAKERTQQVRQEKVRLKENKTKLSENLNSLEDLNGIPVSAKDKKVLPAYMMDRTVKLENGNQISPMQRDLVEALKDDNKALLLAKLLKSNFDFSKIKSEEKEKVLGKVKAGLRRTKDESKGGGKTSTSNSNRKKSLADYL